MITVQELSDLVIEYRIKNNLNQKELAKKLNISNKTLCNIEKRENTVRNITLKKVAMKLKDNNF